MTLAVLPIVKSDPISPNSDLNQTSFLEKIRPKSDQKLDKIRPSLQKVSHLDSLALAKRSCQG